MNSADRSVDLLTVNAQTAQVTNDLHSRRPFAGMLQRLEAVRPWLLPTNCLTMLSDDGGRRLAIAVLQQAVADLQSPIPEYRRSAASYIGRREDFDLFWCALVGLDPDAVRARLLAWHRKDAA